jgi:hypothetical protein
MTTPIIQIGLEPFTIDQPVAPGSPFWLDIENPDKDDWSADSLACDVRDEEGNLMFRVTSADGEIVVDGTNKTRMTMTWSIAKTALLTDHAQYKFDLIVTSTKQIVWPLTLVTTTERVTA